MSDTILTYSFGRFLGRGSPTYGIEVFSQSEEAMVLPGIGPHLDETAASHHVLKTCRCWNTQDGVLREEAEFAAVGKYGKWTLINRSHSLLQHLFQLKPASKLITFQLFTSSRPPSWNSYLYSLYNRCYRSSWVENLGLYICFIRQCLLVTSPWTKYCNAALNMSYH